MTSALKVSGALKVGGALKVEDTPVDEASTMGEAELEFAIFCIESVAQKLGCDPVTVYDALAQSDLLDGYIVPCFDALHTQGKEYIVREIIEVLHERGGGPLTVWHGSSLEVATPDLLHARPNTDFGRGFYITPIYEQALSFTHRFKRRHQGGVISRYSFDEAAAGGLNVLRFASYSDEWLAFVLSCRSGQDTSTYDIVSGGVANDREGNASRVCLDVLNGCSVEREFRLRNSLRFAKQIALCLRTEAALSLLHYEGSESI